MQLLGNEWVMVLPNDASGLREAVLYKRHGSALGGHFGRRKLESLVLTQVLLGHVGS